MTTATPTFDVSLARSDTPACENIIHLNNAGAALMPQPVLEAMVNYVQLEATIGAALLHNFADDAWPGCACIYQRTCRMREGVELSGIVRVTH